MVTKAMVHDRLVKLEEMIEEMIDKKEDENCSDLDLIHSALKKIPGPKHFAILDEPVKTVMSPWISYYL